MRKRQIVIFTTTCSDVMILTGCNKTVYVSMSNMLVMLTKTMGSA